jgi:hypothetical protein
MSYFLVFQNQLDQVLEVSLNYFRIQRFLQSNLYKTNEEILLSLCLSRSKDKKGQGYAYMYQQDLNKLVD